MLVVLLANIIAENLNTSLTRTSRWVIFDSSDSCFGGIEKGSSETEPVFFTDDLLCFVDRTSLDPGFEPSRFDQVPSPENLWIWPKEAGTEIGSYLS